MNYVGDELDGERPFVDLYDLLRRAAGCKELDESVQAKAKAAMAAIEPFMIGSFGMAGYAGFESGKNGVFIVFPDGAAPRAATLGGTTRAWGSFNWYSPLAAKSGRTVNGNLAWCRDGAIAGDAQVGNWFELLDAWFDADNGPAGGLNGWRW
jgi:clostripain